MLKFSKIVKIKVNKFGGYVMCIYLYCINKNLNYELANNPLLLREWSRLSTNF